jgi:hypothetical protein
LEVTDFDRAIAAGYDPMPGEWAQQAQEVRMSVEKDFFDSLSGEFEKAEVREEGGDSWNPAAGETLKGVFMTVEYVNGKWGWNAVGVIKDIETQDAVTVWFSPTILKDQMDSLKPAPGTAIAIRYDGEQKSEKGRNYKKHLVAMPEREEGDVILGVEYWAEQEATAKAKDAAKQDERAAVQGDRPDEAPF